LAPDGTRKSQETFNFENGKPYFYAKEYEELRRGSIKSQEMFLFIDDKVSMHQKGDKKPIYLFNKPVTEE